MGVVGEGMMAAVREKKRNMIVKEFVEGTSLDLSGRSGSPPKT